MLTNIRKFINGKIFSNHQFKKAQYGSVCIKKILLFVKKFLHITKQSRRQAKKGHQKFFTCKKNLTITIKEFILFFSFYEKTQKRGGNSA
jgi:hypothetical protein